MTGLESSLEKEFRKKEKLKINVGWEKTRRWFVYSLLAVSLTANAVVGLNLFPKKETSQSEILSQLEKHTQCRSDLRSSEEKLQETEKQYLSCQSSLQNLSDGVAAGERNQQELAVNLNDQENKNRNMNQEILDCKDRLERMGENLDIRDKNYGVIKSNYDICSNALSEERDKNKSLQKQNSTCSSNLSHEKKVNKNDQMYEKKYDSCSNKVSEWSKSYNHLKSLYKTCTNELAVQNNKFEQQARTISALQGQNTKRNQEFRREYEAELASLEEDNRELRLKLKKQIKSLKKLYKHRGLIIWAERECRGAREYFCH